MSDIPRAADSSAVTIDLSDDSLHFIIAGPKHRAHTIKAIPNIRRGKCTVSYVNALHLTNVPGARFTERASYAVEDAYSEASNRWRQANTDIEREPLTARWTDMSRLQKRGAQWLTVSSGAILADEMGSGKTVQVCQAIDALGLERVMIVCPNAVVRTWYEHCVKWTSHLKPVIVAGTPGVREQLISDAFDGQTFMLIIGWHQLRLHSRQKGFGSIRLTDSARTPQILNSPRAELDLVVADEAHRAKNPEAQQTRALWAVSDSAARRWAITGSPVSNNPTDFWSLLRFAAPHDWTSRMQYIDRYCTTTYNHFSGMHDVSGWSDNTREEFDALISPTFVRRKMSEIIGREIHKERSRRYVQLDRAHKREYDSMRERLIAQIQNGELTVSNALTAATRLYQLASGMLKFDGEDVVFVDPCPKAAMLIELLADIDEPVVVMAHHERLAYHCSTKLREEFSYVTGRVPLTHRDIEYSKFKDGKTRVLLTTVGTSAEGIDLANARVMIFLQRPWSSVQSSQAEDRISRWTQQSTTVEIIDVISQDTIDERVLEMLNVKRRHLHDLTREELVDLL